MVFQIKLFEKFAPLFPAHICQGPGFSDSCNEQVRFFLFGPQDLKSSVFSMDAILACSGGGDPLPNLLGMKKP